MKYQIPSEARTSSFARYAVHPITPMLIGVLTGYLPGLAWMALNAHFLECRDAKKQTYVAIIGFMVVTSISVYLKYLRNIEFFKDTFGEYELVTYLIFRNCISLGYFLIIAWMVFRQSAIADYWKEASLPIGWGIPMAVVLAALHFMFLAPLTSKIPYLYHVWGM